MNSPNSFKGKNVLIGVTGSVAAYKSPYIVRMLSKRGFNVRCIATKSALDFIGKRTLESLTRFPLIVDFNDELPTSGINHIDLADWADVVLIAPASADFIAKLTYGIADNPLLAVVLAAKCPIIVAPAMNVNMYENRATANNIDILIKRGVSIIEPEVGDLACGWSGKGRLADPWDIFQATLKALSEQDLFGKRILIATGPTREAIDDIRFISNRSSGKMGVALAREAYRRGGEVTLVHGPVAVKVPREVRKIPIVSANDLLRVMLRETFEVENKPSIVIMVAAVADFRPDKVYKGKIKKDDGISTLKLALNPDVLASLGEKRGKSATPILVGFAIEVGEIEDLLVATRDKLKKKNCDMIVGNFAEEALDLDTNRVWIVDKHGKQDEIATTFKSRIANKIISRILKL